MIPGDSSTPRPASVLARAARLEAAGRAEAKALLGGEACPGTSPLGRFNDADPLAVILRRVLLRLRLPLPVAALVGRLAGCTFGDDYLLWRGARAAIGRRSDWSRLTGGVRILMYHAVGGPGERGSTYVVPSSMLARQLALVDRLGFIVISLDAYVAARGAGRLPPRRALILTFDDGYADVADVAAPLLRARRHPATVFVVTSAVCEDACGSGCHPLLPRPVLSWRGLAALDDAAIGVGGHGDEHRPLASLPEEYARADIAACAAALAMRVPPGPHVLAFPHGDHDSGVAALAADCGFAAGVTSRPGLNDPATPLYGLRRIEVRGTMSIARFVLALVLGRGTLLRRRTPP